METESFGMLWMIVSCVFVEINFTIKQTFSTILIKLMVSKAANKTWKLAMQWVKTKMVNKQNGELSELQNAAHKEPQLVCILLWFTKKSHNIKWDQRRTKLNMY